MRTNYKSYSKNLKRRYKFDRCDRVFRKISLFLNLWIVLVWGKGECNKSIITRNNWKRLKHSGQLCRRLKITPVSVTCYSSPLSPEKSKITLITPLLRPSNRFLCSVRKAVSTTAIYLHRGEYSFVFPLVFFFFSFVQSSNIYSEKSICINYAKL